MKVVTAIIKPFMLDDVRDALLAIKIRGLTVSEVKGFGSRRGHSEIYGNVAFTAVFLPKLKIEVLTSDDTMDAVVDAIMGAARTGDKGDGKIYAYSLDIAARIRTGERGVEAL